MTSTDRSIRFGSRTVSPAPTVTCRRSPPITPAPPRCQNTGPPHTRAAAYGTTAPAKVLPTITPPRRSHGDHQDRTPSSAVARDSEVPRLADSETNGRRARSYTGSHEIDPDTVGPAPRSRPSIVPPATAPAVT